MIFFWFVIKHSVTSQWCHFLFIAQTFQGFPFSKVVKLPFDFVEGSKSKLKANLKTFMTGEKKWCGSHLSEVFLFEVESRFSLDQVSGVTYGLKKRKERKAEEERKLIIHSLIPPLWCNCSLSLIVIQACFISMQSDKSLTQSEPVSTSRCWPKSPIQKYYIFFSIDVLKYIKSVFRLPPHS